MRYVLSLYESGTLESGLDASDDLDALLAEQVETGWEDDPDRLRDGMLLVTEGVAGPIVATLAWAVVTGQEWPDLLVSVLLDGSQRRYRRVDSGETYAAELVA